MATESRGYTGATETDHELAMSRAMMEAIVWEMRGNEKVFYMGEGVADYGGILFSTTGLLDEFGRDRVVDVPISETAYLGVAVGTAQADTRPAAELMFVDFFDVAMGQIYSNTAKNTYMSGGSFSVPMVLATTVGGIYNDAGQHSRMLYGTLTHLPGMKVIVPSTAYNTRGLMHTVIRDDDPVVYMLHKRLMGLGWVPSPSGPKTGVSEEDYAIPFGEVDMKRPGDDVTIITLGLYVHRAMKATERLDDDGIDVEVIGLRTFVPLDTETVFDSVRKTGKLLVVNEDYRSFGVTGKIIARAAEGALDDLLAAERLAVHDVSISYACPLEDEVNPGTDDIAAVVHELHE